MSILFLINPSAASDYNLNNYNPYLLLFTLQSFSLCTFLHLIFSAKLKLKGPW